MISKETNDTQTPKSKAQVIIAGAGPVGLLIALGLGRAGIDTLVVEAHNDLLHTTRAIVYMPVVIPVLKKLGILDVVLENAFLNDEGVRWRDITGKELAHLPLASSNKGGDFGGVLLIGQWRMNRLILEELQKYPSVEVRFGLRCVGIEDQPESSPTVKLMTHTRNNLVDNDVLLEANYVIGTDGANSSIRRLLCLPFEGFTFQDFKMIGTDVCYDFIEHEDFTPLNFVVHEKDWAVIAYSGEDEHGNAHKQTTGKPLWRIAYVEDPNLPDAPDEIKKRAHEQVKKYIRKGDQDAYSITRAEPYYMQQRLASQPRKGRVYLAGDALHSNNPIGGLGLTGGILDAFCYGNAFARVLKNGESESLLHNCALARWNAWRGVTNKLSQDNMNRLYAMDKHTVGEREAFFKKLNNPKIGPLVANGVRTALETMMCEDFGGLSL